MPTGFGKWWAPPKISKNAIVINCHKEILKHMINYHVFPKIGLELFRFIFKYG